MDLPKPPKDTELRNIIDKLAQFVARNGPEFEHMTKTKQKNNPKFQFLYGGEHFNYYQYKVTTEQAILKQGHKTKQNNNVTQNSITNNVSPWANIPTPSGILTVEQLGQQQNILQEQIRQSEQNLNAQYAVLTQQQQTQIDDTVRRAEEDALQRLATDSEVDLDALDQLLQPIMDSCTKDSISNGKGWILQNATNQDKCEAISKHLMKKIIHGTSTFLQKLHIIYLVNDVLHHCARKHADELKKALEEVVVPMFCSTTVGVTDDQKAKLDKLLSLWESKANYFTAETVQKLHNPSDSYQEYQASLITKHASAISTLTQNMKTTFEGYQAQHNAFVSHASQQIQVLEQQKQNLEKQNTFLPPSNFQQNNLSSSFPQHQIPQPSPLPGQTNFIPEDTGNSNQSNVSQNSMPSESSQNQSDSNNFNPLSNQTPTNGNLENVNQIFPSVNQTIPPNTIPQNIPGANPINPASLSAILPIDPSLPPPNINISNSGPELALNFNQPPPGFLPPPGIFPDFSKPPPGFPIPPQLPPPVEEIFPSVPYYDLPAGLIVPLIKLEDRSYKPLDASTIRLPPPAPPSDRLLTAVEAFYGPPSHERPRDSDGWEKLGLYEYYRAKNLAKKQKDEQIAAGLRQKSKSPSPIVIKKSDKDQDSKKRRYSSKSPSPRSPVRRRSGSRRDRQRRKRSRSRSRTRSPLPMKRDRSLSPPSSLFLSMSSQAEKEIDETNKGHQLLKKMGWGGSGLGAKGQGIEAPIAGGEIRDRQDMYKGVGVNVNDPYENFRKRKVAAIITRMKARAEERAAEERC